MALRNSLKCLYAHLSLSIRRIGYAIALLAVASLSILIPVSFALWDITDRGKAENGLVLNDYIWRI